MLKKWIKNYFVNNKYDVLLFAAIITIGVFIGISTFLLSGEKTQGIVVESVTGVLDLSVKEEFIKANIIADGLKSNLVLILIMIFFSITLFGKWGIYIIMLLKGTGIGIYSAVLFTVFGFWWGLLVNMLLVIIINLIYIPSLIYIAVSLVGLNFYAFKTRNDGLTSKQIFRTILDIFMGFVLIFSSVILEQILSTITLNIYATLA